MNEQEKDTKFYQQFNAVIKEDFPKFLHGTLSYLKCPKIKSSQSYNFTGEHLPANLGQLVTRNCRVSVVIIAAVITPPNFVRAGFGHRRRR